MTATIIVTPSTHLTFGPSSDCTESWYRPRANEMAATIVRIISTLSLKVIHMISRMLFVFFSERRFSPNTRFLSTYRSELVSCPSEDRAGRLSFTVEKVLWFRGLELVDVVTTPDVVIPSTLPSSKLNPLQLSVRSPCIIPLSPPTVRKAAMLFELTSVERAFGDNANGFSCISS